MNDYSLTKRNGIRSAVTWTKGLENGLPVWRSGTSTTTGIVTQSRSLSCTNGTAGDPNRKLATSYSFTKSVTTHGSGSSYSGNANTQYVLTNGASFGSSMAPGGSIPTLDQTFAVIQNRALARLSDKTRGDLDLAIDLLEGRQTAKLVRNATKVFSYIRSFHPRKWADKWLEFQYGWRPLVNSSYGLAQEMVRPRQEGVARYKVRESETLRGFSKSGTGVIDTCESVLMKRIEYVIELDFKANTLEQLSRISSLNPASIAWELMPYSFVVDWFIDIGGYLRCMETALVNDLIFKRGYTTRGYLRIDTERRSGRQDLGGGSYTSYGGCERITRSTHKNRSRLTGYPTPVFPSLNVDLGSSRILSGAALLTQLFQRKLR